MCFTKVRYARQVKLSRQPYVYSTIYVNNIYSTYAAAGACSARNLSQQFWAAYGNTINCNCISISEGTSKLVKRLRQVFLLIKQSISLFALLLCHFRSLKTTIWLLFCAHRVVS